MKFFLSICFLYFFSLNIHTISGCMINNDTGKDNATGVLSVPQASASEVTEGCSGGTNGLVTFFHDNSICYDSELTIVEYRWIFEVEGDVNSAFNSFDWEAISENEFSPDGKHFRISDNNINFHPVYQFMSEGTYTVALKVINNNPAIPDTDIATLTITVTESPNIAPLADAAGTYTISHGDDLILEGFVTDANEPCGDVVSSSWDLDNDGSYDDFTGSHGTVPWSVIESLGLSENIAHEISLMAIDEKSETTYDNTTLTITTTTGIDLGSGQKEAVLYPNPVKDVLIIKPDNYFAKESKIRIIDNKGKVMIESIESGYNSEIRINVSMLNPGIYQIQISSPGYNERQSFIKI